MWKFQLVNSAEWNRFSSCKTGEIKLYGRIGLILFFFRSSSSRLFFYLSIRLVFHEWNFCNYACQRSFWKKDLRVSQFSESFQGNFLDFIASSLQIRFTPSHQITISQNTGLESFRTTQSTVFTSATFKVCLKKYKPKILTSREVINHKISSFPLNRVASMPNTGVEEEYYRLRHFSITGKGIVNRGDSLKSRRSRSNNSVASSNSR